MIAQTAVDLIDMGNLALQQGNVALARWQYEESLIIWRALDDAPGIAHALERLRALEGDPRCLRFNTVNRAAREEKPMTHQTTDRHVNSADETIRLGPLEVRFLLTGDDSTGSIAAFELLVPSAQRLMAPAHSHEHYEETVYGIAGVLTWTVDGKPIDVGPGQALCIPRGAIHRFDNNGSEDVKALCVITPAAIGPQDFREAAEVVNAAAGGPPDGAKMAEIMIRHGLTPARPSAQA
jgi:quercetin dioxygenase-like cupin family protein